ncbi:MAG: hypothetical protein WC451_05320 [Patescibacteria group bacterium]
MKIDVQKEINDYQKKIEKQIEKHNAWIKDQIEKHNAWIKDQIEKHNHVNAPRRKHRGIRLNLNEYSCDSISCKGCGWLIGLNIR